uniref:F-box domain-containing protein n=1 Tax=Coccolithus braarudii TaxID=221442 RepID=A0A7S0LKF4_9EUKA|mmetsp:Transcript_45282/g.96294  ORF Transcript_45282/g.96294 Transcript_45282/m.96294 type:complete len:432 (+) Transcript_45282:187-1482(+)
MNTTSKSAAFWRCESDDCNPNARAESVTRGADTSDADSDTADPKEQTRKYIAVALQQLQGSISRETAEILVRALHRARLQKEPHDKAETLRGALTGNCGNALPTLRVAHQHKAALLEPAFPSLPDELTPCILDHLGARELARVACACRSWRLEAIRIAEHRLRSRRPLGQVRSGINWARALAAEEALFAAVGPRPKHAWWREWAPMRVEEVLLTGQPQRYAHAALYEPRGAMSVMSMLCRYAGGLSWMFDAGWALHQAAACLLIGTFGTAAIGLHLRCGSAKYAASTYAYCDALSARAWSLAAAAPLTYSAIDGVFGLGTTDTVWLMLEDEEVEKGMQFQTSAAVMASVEPVGMQEPQEPTVANAPPLVCFHSELAANGMLRSLLQVSPTNYQLPPLAQITVLYTQAAGEWQAFGRTMRRRCVHVSVSVPY